MSHSPEPEPERSRRAVKESLSLLKKLGGGAKGLWQRLRNVRTPEEMQKEMEHNRRLNLERREELSRRLETLYREISEGKTAMKTAAPARKRVLQLELKNKLSQYQAAERTLAILLENDRALSLASERLHEIQAYGMAGVTQDDIERLTDDIDEAADDAEGRLDSLKDLEKAGARRTRELDDDDFLAALEEFGESESDDADESPQAEPAPERKSRTPEPPNPHAES